MSYKLIGAILIIVGCGGFGFLIAANYKAEQRHLKELLRILNEMTAELQYRLTPLPELIDNAAKQASGALRKTMIDLKAEISGQTAPDVDKCMYAAMEKNPDLPVLTGNMLRLLGKTLGRFDLDGQISEISSVIQEINENLSRLTADKDVRLRSYRTLGLCAGFAIAILLI